MLNQSPQNPPDHSIDILIAASVDANELTGLLNDPGLLGTWVEDQAIHVYWDPAHWSTQTHSSIFSALNTLGITHPEDYVGIHSLPSQDWNAQWARHVQPIRLGHHIRIRPSWEPASTNPQDIELIIDPKQAFGTGHHATTQLLAEWLEDIIEGGETLLDVGTGSGILAMVGIRLGAKKALGFDCDKQAIECAREYARTNGFGPELEFRVATLAQCPPVSWDRIVANVDRRTLVGMAGQLAPFLSADGQLFLSGLLADDRDDINAAFACHGWMIQESRVQEEWLALQLIHPGQP